MTTKPNNPQPTVAVIPARGGSKSIPGKNIAVVAGRPLLAWSIEVAQQVAAIDRIIVSTDDEAIADVAGQYGAEVSRRPPHLATDDSLVIDTLRDLIHRLREEGSPPGILVLLEPTAPLRLAQDVEECLAQLQDPTVDSVATFVEAKLNPARAWIVRNGRPESYISGINPWLPRQRLRPAYQLNGAVYAFRVDRLEPDSPAVLFGNMAAVMMPAERSVDIDDRVDLQVADALLRQRRVSEGP